MSELAQPSVAPRAPFPGRDALRAWGWSAALATALLWVSAGNPLVVVGLAAVLGLLWLVWRAPLRVTALGLLGLVLLIDEPALRPFTGAWTSPWAPLGEVLYENLHKFTGIEALRFALLDLAIIALLGLALWRRLTGAATREQVAPAPAPLFGALAGALLAMVLLIGWGLARGGDFRNSLWQVRQLLMLPLVTLLFLAALRGSRDLPALFTLLIGAALAKTALALWVYETVFRPMNVRPAHVTTHADSMLFALALVAVLALWHELPTRRTWALQLTAGPALLLAMKINNRRLVFVEVAVAALAISPLLPWSRLKRNLARAVILAVPLAALYLAAGWNNPAGIFRPVQLVRSIAQPSTDRSTAMRDIENYNLTVTFRASPLLGTGFGHPYVEQVKADDISEIFSLYRFIPHNSVLALWAFCGTLGFSVIWLPVLMGLFLAARTFRMATAPGHRAAALTALGMVIIHLLQAWGDMGLQSWEGVFLLGACLAMVGQLAVEVGAYPAPPRPAGQGGHAAEGNA